MAADYIMRLWHFRVTETKLSATKVVKEMDEHIEKKIIKMYETLRFNFGKMNTAPKHSLVLSFYVFIIHCPMYFSNCENPIVLCSP